MDRTAWLLFGIVAILVILAILALFAAGSRSSFDATDRSYLRTKHHCHLQGKAEASEPEADALPEYHRTLRGLAGRHLRLP